MLSKCKKCRGTGWRSGDLGSDATHSILLQVGIDFDVACDCPAGQAHLEEAKREAKSKQH